MPALCFRTQRFCQHMSRPISTSPLRSTLCFADLSQALEMLCKYANHMPKYANAMRFFSGSEMTVFTKQWRPLTVWRWTLSDLMRYPRLSWPSSTSCRGETQLSPSAVPLFLFKHLYISDISLHIYLHISLHVFSAETKLLLLCDRDLVHDLTQVLSLSHRVQHVVQCVVQHKSKSATKCHTAQESATRRQRIVKISNKSVQFIRFIRFISSY